MRTSAAGLVVLGVAAALTLSACSSDKKTTSTTPTKSSGPQVGIILPDTTSSPRWVSSDPTALKGACASANITCDIQNANGDASKMKTIAQSMQSEGVKVLMIVNLDSASGAAIEDEAKKNGIITVDYDRLTLGGGASLYVSFDNTKVGAAQGTALTQCPQVAGKTGVKYVEIDGKATDNNATLFKAGYDGVLSKTPGWTRVADQNGQWDGPTAASLFTTMLADTPSITAVMTANDTMADGVIGKLQDQKVNGQVAVAGQDASAQGLQHILDGDQCFTIYKPTAGEAVPAIKAVAQLLKGETPSGTTTIMDTQTNKPVPALLADPIVITKANVADPINANDTPKGTVCTGAYVAKCTAAGVK